MWWQWLIFALLLIIVPLAIGNLAVWIRKKNKPTKEQEKVMNINLAKYMLFYWLCDLFYMAFIIDSVICKYIFGGLIMLIIFYNLSCSVINQSSRRRHGIIRFGIIQDFVVGVGISVYLIYIISDTALQQILLAIVAAIYGGLFTLVGVAWTIKKGDADRNAELIRIEKERKEEDRKLHIPYLKVVKGVQPLEAVNCHIKQPLNFDDAASVAQLKDDIFYSIRIDNFIVKNVSSHNVLMRGMSVDGVFYKFDKQLLLEKDNVCQVQTTRNFELSFITPIKELLIYTEDIIGNLYTVACGLNPDLMVAPILVTTDDGKEYRGYCYQYKIENIGLPTFVGEKL